MNKNINRQEVVNFICEHAIDIVLDLGIDIAQAEKKKSGSLTMEDLQEICPRYFDKLEDYVNTGLTMYERMLKDNTKEEAQK